MRSSSPTKSENITPEMWLRLMRTTKNMKERQVLERALRTKFARMRKYREYVLPKRVEAYECARPPTEEEEILDRINHFRIDCVCVDDSGTHYIIEAKVKLNPEAIGQVLVFSELYKRFNKLLDTDIKRVIVCEKDEPVLRFLCEKWDIEVIVV